jgi:hypothetical protein
MAMPKIEILLAENGARLEGVVQTGRKPAAAFVVFAPQPSCPEKPYLYKHRMTDSNGRFQFTGIAPGEYKLFALKPDLEYAEPEWWDFREGAGVTIVLSASARESVRLDLIDQESTR